MYSLHYGCLTLHVTYDNILSVRVFGILCSVCKVVCITHWLPSKTNDLSLREQAEAKAADAREAASAALEAEQDAKKALDEAVRRTTI